MVIIEGLKRSKPIIINNFIGKSNQNV